MIFDTLDQWGKYRVLCKRFPAAFQFLARADLAAVAPGRHEVEGAELYASVEHRDGRGREGARLEAHRKYIDIQYTVAGVEVIGWRPLAECKRIAEPFNEERDVGFYAERPETWLVIPAGHFAIFWPDDAHAPLAGEGLVHKVVMKVAVE